MEQFIISCVIFHIILYLAYKPYSAGEYHIPDKKMWIMMLLCIIYGTYGTHYGDYFRYDEMVEFYGTSPWNDVGYAMEPQYYHLAKLVKGTPWLWRLAINSITFLGLGFFLEKANMNNYPTLLFFIVSCLFWAAGHRGWWGLIYFFFGVYLCFYKKNYIYLLFCAAVLYSHASHIVLLALLPIVFFRFNKYIALFAIAAMVASLSAFQDYFNMLVMTGVEDEYAAEKLTAYTTQGGQNFFGDSLGEILQNLTSKIPTYIFFFYLFKKVIFDRKFRNTMSRELNALVNVAFCLFFASLACNLIDMNSGTFATRLFSMLALPAVMMAPLVLQGENSKYYGTFIKWKWISIELTYFFALFYTIIHHS